MLSSLDSWLAGYLRVKISGKYLEVEVNRLMRQGVVFWDISRIENSYHANIKLEDFQKLEAELEGRDYRLEVLTKKGLPFWKQRLVNRRALVVGIIIFLLAVNYLLSQFILAIEIKGTEKLETEELRALVASEEIGRGTAKSEVSLSELEDLIVKQREIAWANTYFQGVKLVIEVEEKELLEKMESCDLVAQRSGLITELIPLKGTPQVEEGMTVSKGDILISRYVPITEQLPTEEGEEPKKRVKEIQEVKAEGIAKARVWYEGYGEAGLDKYHHQPTGEVETSLIINYKGQERVITGPRKPPYTYFEVEEEVKSLPEWRNYSLPLEIIRRRYIQLAEVKEERSFKQAKRLAQKRARKNLLQRLAKEPIILNSKFKLVETAEDKNLVRVKALLEVEEEIGIRRE